MRTVKCFDMEGQMTIFDFLGDYGTLSEEDVVQSIEDKLDIKFIKKDDQYEWKRKSLKLTVSVDTDCAGKSFVSCGYNYKLNGGGSPIYNLNESVEWFKYILELFGKEK